MPAVQPSGEDREEEGEWGNYVAHRRRTLPPKLGTAKNFGRSGVSALHGKAVHGEALPPLRPPKRNPSAIRSSAIVAEHRGRRAILAVDEGGAARGPPSSRRSTIGRRRHSSLGAVVSGRTAPSRSWRTDAERSRRSPTCPAAATNGRGPLAARAPRSRRPSAPPGLPPPPLGLSTAGRDHGPISRRCRCHHAPTRGLRHLGTDLRLLIGSRRASCSHISAASTRHRVAKRRRRKPPREYSEPCP